MIRRRVIYHGRVQGVGFRATTHSIASRFDVAGYVRNMPDGTVELVAEGVAGEIEAFLAAVAERFSRHVTKAESTTVDDDEPLSDFSIRYR